MFIAGRKRSLLGSRRGMHGVSSRAGADARSCEQLEQRMMLSGGFSGFTAQEVYLTELVNRARANPTAEGARLGLDLTAGLTSQEIARLIPQEPLAMSPELTLAARAHSQDMADRAFFDHTNPDGDSPTDRAQASGYSGTAGENIAAGYVDIDAVHRAWLESVGHRKNILSLHTSFDDSFHYDQFGAGFAFTDIGPYFDYYTEVFGVQAGTAETFLLGVVYDDTDNDDFYTVGEGASGVRIDVRASAGGSVLESYTTDAAGNYQIALGSGTYHVTFTELSSSKVYTTSVTMSGENRKVDVLTEDLMDPPPPPPPGDDYANYPLWTDAHTIPLESTTGNGAVTGLLETGGDTDLFVFRAPISGMGTITVVAENGRAIEGTLFNSSRFSMGDFGSTPSSVNWTAGDQYYVRVSGAADATYLVLVTGPEEVAEPDPTPTPTPEPVSGTRSADPVSGVGDNLLAGGRLALTFHNRDDGATLLVQDINGSWSTIDLTASAGGPTSVSGKVSTWVDPKDGRLYAAVNSTRGVLLYTNSARDGSGSGVWTYRNLTDENAGAQALASGNITVFLDDRNRMQIAGQAADGDLIIYWQTKSTNGPGGGFVWRSYDVSDDHIRDRGWVSPTITGELTSWITDRGQINVAGLDANGDIQVFYRFSKAFARWRVGNLSDIADAPAYVGNLAVYQRGKTTYVNATTAGGEVWQHWWRVGAQWKAASVTSAAGNPAGVAFVEGSVSGYINANGVQTVVGLNNRGDVEMFWYMPRGGWNHVNLSDYISGDEPGLTGRLVSDIDRASGRVSIVGATSSGELVEYAWTSQREWFMQNVSVAAGG